MTQDKKVKATLDQRVEILEATCEQLALERSVMHRALIRCQARCHVLAEPPKGWMAVLIAIRNLVISEKTRERLEIKRIAKTNSLALIDQLPEEPADKTDEKK